MSSIPALEQPFTLGSLTLRNRIVMPPMCQYSVDAHDGIATDWHYVHYLSRAIGGTGLIIMEMTNVTPDGRISNRCLGIWSDEQVEPLARIVRGMKQYGAAAAIQIGHAGRKAQDAAEPVAPSAVRFDENYKVPRALTTDEVAAHVEAFRDGVRRAVEAGFDTIELHGAHGYLIHQFHSPAINTRTDRYGEQLSLFGVEVIRAAKSVMPAGMPLIMRVSAVEYMDGGYDLDYSIPLFKEYRDAGIDIFHISSGGEGPVGRVRQPGTTAGYQVGYAQAVREALGVPVIAVGYLDDAHVANAVVERGHAELVAVGRGMLRDAYWSYHALRAVGSQTRGILPKPYGRGEL